MISEIDIKDWERSDQPIELWKANSNTVVETTNGVMFWLHDVLLSSALCSLITQNKIGPYTYLSPYISVYPYARKNN